MDEILFNIIKLLVIIVITAIARYGIPLMKTFIENSKMNQAFKWAKVGVEAAQQTIKGEGCNPAKKQIVTEFLKEILMAKNISITDQQLDNLIEAAVFAMKNGKEA